jgi:type II secretory pathway pseudopilin PulG
MKHMTSFHSNPRRLSGFTLTELLVILGIVAILAIFSLGVFGRARTSAGKATAVSAMRQTANAVFLFASENNGYLPPGPGRQGLWLSHHAYDQKHTLFGFLGPYMGQQPLDSPQPVKSAVSSSHLRQFPDLLRPRSGSRLNVYSSSRSIELSNGSRKEVFGFYGAYATNEIKSALSLADVQSARDNGWKWLLQEADQSGGWSASWDAATFPPTPVHGDTRHRLLTDGSVIQLSLSSSNIH